MTSTPPNGLTVTSEGGFPRSWAPPALLLEASAGDDGLILALIDAFFQDTDARIAQMHVDLAASDFPHLRSEAHTVKGSASQMGADALADACRELELASGRRDAALIPALLNRIEARFDEIRGEMAAFSRAAAIE